MKKDNVQKMFETFVAHNPAPRTELDYSNGFTLISAVLLSAQATDVGVNKATKSLFEVADTPEQMVALGLETITDYIRTIGLYKNKAKNLLAMSQMLIDDYNSEIPDKMEDLIRLPGVGRKTANVVLNELFEVPTCAVDTHVFRVSNRTGLAKGKTPDAVEGKLYKVIPEEYLLHAHHHLILHGRYVCKARKPDCANCEIYDVCAFKDKVI